MDFFLHPWFMVAGGALVSAPILIHLINRMRFRRVRWAAMEFLLKSQKRNRRRLIIEQMILLALRCLLVLLAGFLVARFVGATGPADVGTLHYIVVDDTLSMRDQWRDARGQNLTCYDVAKDQLRELLRQAGQANSPQAVRVYLLSDLDTPVFDEPRITDQTIERLRGKLDEFRPTALHIDPVAAVERAREFFTDKQYANAQKVLHFVGDFRDTDWGTGPGVEKLNEAVDRLLDAGVNLSLIDTAHPYRSETKGVAIDHGNLALTDLRAEARTAAAGVPVEFTATVQNFGSAEKKPFLKVRVDGVEDFGASQPVNAVPPGERREVKFRVLFAKKRPAPDLKDGEPREERERKRLADREYAHVRAELEGDDSGLRADNVRDLVIEVRKAVPALVVDGAGEEGRRVGGDSFHVAIALAAARAYDVDWCPLEQLEAANLDPYPTVYLLNVPQIRSEKALEKLDKFVRDGGSLAYFVGEKVQATFYNDTLFRKYGGLFPVLLAPRPTEPLSDAERDERRRDEQPKILFREPPRPDEPTAGLYTYRAAFRYLMIDRHWPALPRFQWDPEGKEVKELIVLPNRRPMDDYKARAQELLNQALERTRELAAEAPAFARYVPAVEKYRRDVINALGTPYLYNLAVALDDLVHDTGSDKEPVRPNMTELWSQGKMAGLRRQLEGFRDQVLYGDPLLVARAHGKGRVVACLTAAGSTRNPHPEQQPPAGTQWNDWGSGSPVQWSYEIFLKDLQRYLTGESDEFNRLVGDGVSFPLDAARYQPKVEAAFTPQPEAEGRAAPDAAAAAGPPPVEKLGTLPLPLKDNVLTFTFNQSRRPGVYAFTFFPAASGAAEPVPEPHAYAFNVDAAREGDLRRAPAEKLERRSNPGDPRAARVSLRSPGDSFEQFRNRQPDASESPWLYLLFIVVLTVEQALAVHLSFHLKGNEAAPPAAAGPRAGAAAAA
jgi:hypothetical protein